MTLQQATLLARQITERTRWRARAMSNGTDDGYWVIAVSPPPHEAETIVTDASLVAADILYQAGVLRLP